MRQLDIGEVARRSGVPASTLRYYEEKGLIASSGRHVRRLFDAGVLERLALIGLAAPPGCRWTRLPAWAQPTARCGSTARAGGKADELDRTIRRLAAMRDGLRHAAACPAREHGLPDVPPPAAGRCRGHQATPESARRIAKRPAGWHLPCLPAVALLRAPVRQRLDLAALVALAVVLVEHLLAQADRLRRHFHQLVVGDELQRLLEGEADRRNQGDDFVLAGARMLSSFLPLVGLITRSLSRLLMPANWPS